MHATSQQEQPLAVQQSNTPWRTLRRTFVAALLLGLAVLNVAILTQEKAHSTAYDGFKQMLGYMVADEILDRLLRHSPSNVRKGDVERKTAALRTENTKLKQTYADLDTTSKDLQTKHTKLSADHDDLDRRHKKLDVDHKDLTQRHVTLEKNHLALSKQHQDLVKVKSDNELRTRQATQKLSTNVAKRSRNIAFRNVAGAAGEAVPFVGIPIVAGLLALEMRDLCLNLEDLNEMNIALGNAQVDNRSVCGVHVPTSDELQAKVLTNWKQGYKEAMEVLGRPIVIPTISWDQVKAPVCAMVSVPGIC